MNPPRIDIEQLKVRRAGHLVLKVDELSLPPGCRIALLGGNGAGKTTLLHAMAGLQDLDEGRIKFDGKLFHAGPAPATKTGRAVLGLALQDPYMLAGSVAQNVAFGLKCHGIPRADRGARVSKALKRLGISDLAERRATALSGGERKLVSLAQLVALAPPIILLDEPTAGLDAEASELLENLVLQWSGRGHSIIVATHDSMWTRAVKAKEIVLQAGRLVREPEPETKESASDPEGKNLPPPPLD